MGSDDMNSFISETAAISVGEERWVVEFYEITSLRLQGRNHELCLCLS